MKNTIQIVEVSARDGLQSETEILSTETKLQLISRAIEAGIRRLEVTSFVHPKKVPQMADAEALIAGLPRKTGASFIGLVLNQRGLERALATQIDEIGMAVIATDTYNQRNQGTDTQGSIDAWLTIAEQAKAEGRKTSVMISAAFGCPFEGEVPVQRVLEIAKQVMQAEPDELAVADSIGVGVPKQVHEVIGALKDAYPNTPLRCHFHNTRNTGLANAQAAVDAGVNRLDASIGGIGGCPFAPAATGNIPTDDLLYLLDRSGVETNVSLATIINTSEWLQQQLKHDIPAMLPKAGIPIGFLADRTSA